MYVFVSGRQDAIMANLETVALIALGSNENSFWGDAAETVQKAIKLLSKLSKSDASYSALYATPAFPDPKCPPFVNAAMAITTRLNAASLLQILHETEARAGRKREKRWGQRTLDIDLIGFGDLVLPDVATQTKWRALSPDAQMTDTPDQLILPHPRLQDRSFVLVPLADIAPHWRHPILEKTVDEMLKERPQCERDAVQRR